VIQTSKLSNGLRVITDTVNTVESVAVGVWVDVGTRNEDMVENGVAHMVEHMLFNGTPTRNAQDIAAEIENVGGQMNAYTSRETTAYYIHLLKEDAERAIDILSDMIQNATFPDQEIEKERGVIAQEIGMTLDTPDDYVYDLYQHKAYPGQALGAPILGSADIIQKMSKESLTGYVKNHYTPKNLVLSIAGNITHAEAVKLAEKYFNALPEDKDRTYAAAKYDGGDAREEKELEQIHIVTGFQGVSKTADDYYASILMATILGGGMSSRLFQEIREKRGLAYSVYASHTGYKDDGQFEIYAGTGADKIAELVPVLCDELKKITGNAVNDDELARAKAQLRSGTLMGRESMLSRANKQARHMMSFDKVLDIPELIAQIDGVRVADVQSIAGKIFDTTPTLAVLGPLGAIPTYDEVKTQLAA